MRKLPPYLLLGSLFALQSHALPSVAHTPTHSTPSTTEAHCAPSCGILPSDTTRTTKDKTSQPQRKQQDHVKTDTLQEVEVRGKGLTVINAINKSLKKDQQQPGQKTISDVIGSKATDYIMNPTAWRERRKEKNLKRTEQSIKKLEAAQTYEDELTDAINRQLREDSIAQAKKKQ